MAITMKKCPLCMGRIKDGYCEECGYRVPDEEEFEQMSSLYDFEPDNYPKPEYEPEPMERGQQVQYAEPEKPRIPSIRVVDNNTPPPSPPPHPRHDPTYNANVQNGTNQPVTPGTGNNAANQPYGSNQPYTPGTGNNNANQPYYNQNGNYGQNSGGKPSFSVSAKDIPWGELILTLMIPILGIIFGIKHLNRGKNDPVQQMIGVILLILGIFRLFMI